MILFNAKLIYEIIGKSLMLTEQIHFINYVYLLQSLNSKYWRKLSQYWYFGIQN